MSPSEKAHDLMVRFFILPDEVSGVADLTGAESRQMAKLCAIICVEQMIEAVSYVEDAEYWKEVLEILKNS